MSHTANRLIPLNPPLRALHLGTAFGDDFTPCEITAWCGEAVVLREVNKPLPGVWLSTWRDVDR